MNKQFSLTKHLAIKISNNPRACILIGIILFIVFIPGIRLFHSDFSYRIWFSKNDPLLKQYDSFERQFGNDETIAVIVHNPNGVFNTESLSLLTNLTKDLWQVPEIIRVDSLTNYNWTHSENDEIIIEPLIPDEAKLTNEFIEQRKQVALSHEIIPGYLVSKDGKTAVIYTLVKPSFEGSPDYHRIIAGDHKNNNNVEGIRDKISKYSANKNFSFHITGAGAVTNCFQESSIKDLSFLVPILIGMIIIVTLFLIRSFLGLILSLFVIAFTVLVTFGFAGYTGITMNTVVSTLPNILTAICIADAIHIIVTWFQFKSNHVSSVKRLEMTLKKNIKPTFLTSLTTAIGFLSFSSAKVLPISYQGYLAGFGVIVAWIMTILIIGPALLLFSKKYSNTGEAKNEEILKPKEWALKFAGIISIHHKNIIITFSLLTLAAFIVGLQNEVNSDPFKYFPKHSSLRIANDFLEEHVGGAAGIEIIVRSGKENGIKDPAFLAKVERFQNWLNQNPYVTKTISIIDILKQTNRSLNNDMDICYSLPETQEAVAQELFLYTMGLPEGMDLNNRMTLNYDSLRISVLWTLHKSKEALQTYEVLKEKAKDMGLDIQITGKTGLYQSMNGNVVQSFISSISLAIIIISLIMMVTFKSFSIGLFTMIPNIVPLIFGAGLMTLLNKPLDIGTVLVASVCLGIAVDDTIHFLNHYYKYLKKGITPKMSIALVFSYTGPALLTTSVILVCGFGTFAFASFVPNINFGILTAMILCTALIADFLFLPALLIAKKNHKKRASSVPNKSGSARREFFVNNFAIF